MTARRLLPLLGLLLAGCDSAVEWSDAPLCGYGIEGVEQRWKARLHRSVRSKISGWECRLADAPEHIRLVDAP